MRFVKASIKYGDDKMPYEGYVNVDQALTIERYGQSVSQTFLRFNHCEAVVDLPYEDFIKKIGGEDFQKKGSARVIK